jgi:hypothetical protein
MLNIQHAKLETYGVLHGAAQVDPSVALKMFLSQTSHDPTMYECQTLARFWVHPKVSILKGRVNKHKIL